MWIHERFFRPILKSIVGESYLRQKGVLGFDFKHLSLSTVKQAAGIVRSKPSKAQSKVAGASWQSWSGCDQCFCASILNLWCAHSQKCRQQNQQNDDLFLSPSSIGHAVICLIIFDWHMSHSSCIPLFCAEPGSAKSIRWSKRYGRTSATSKPADRKPLAVKSGYCKLKRTAPNAMVIKAIFDEKVWFKTFSTRDGSTKGSMKSAKSGQRFRKTVPERPCLNPFAVN